MAWVIEEAQGLTISSLQALFQNEIAALRIPHFLTDDACTAIIEQIHRFEPEQYTDDPEMARVGITQAEHMGEKALYFLRAAAMNSSREMVFEQRKAALLQVVRALRSVWQGQVDVAHEEESNQRYFAGLIRIIGRTRLHFDWAPHDAQDWAIGRISAQLAWNIYLQASERGGTTRVYHRAWQHEDECYREPGSYAFDPALVQNAAYIEIAPRTGELVLFNSRNYHEVEKTEGARQRLSISSFVGLLKPGQRLALWS
ncbi:MAG TPA: 2OG-Fe(II) oxygenase [Ktedonobacteraceae bacterium]|jgi:hypothetical protein